MRHAEVIRQFTFQPHKVSAASEQRPEASSKLPEPDGSGNGRYGSLHVHGRLFTMLGPISLVRLRGILFQISTAARNFGFFGFISGRLPLFFIQ